jgi:hypothetical protein
MGQVDLVGLDGEDAIKERLENFLFEVDPKWRQFYRVTVVVLLRSSVTDYNRVYKVLMGMIGLLKAQIEMHEPRPWFRPRSRHDRERAELDLAFDAYNSALDDLNEWASRTFLVWPPEAS